MCTCVCVHAQCMCLCVYMQVCVYDLCMSRVWGTWTCHDVCIGQGASFQEWVLAIYFVLRLSIYCFCHLTMFSSLVYLQVSRKLPHLCLLSHCRSAGIIDVYYCMCSFYVDFPRSELKCQSCMASAFYLLSHLPGPPCLTFCELKKKFCSLFILFNHVFIAAKTLIKQNTFIK